ncbi:RHS repeat-associated protein [Aeromonas hydrophila]|uniref:RHS repeat-associated core domain-containing protein n=1 Tax=Aeromonas hydrophila TaxID=644 RepID=UPI0021690FBD|nr:RHS repeat-associated core domain-containing protein [Aeromonas hydrophila]MCS3769585.1 RHS repeat-associated protein [Aeromonas hydrophila]
MSKNKTASLLSSDEAAKKNFSTDNIISGGCVKCGCEVIIHYHYDDGKPVPNAPFVLTDSNKTVIKGKTDSKGLCRIYDMGCGTFELLLEEGSDEFKPKETLQNNPVFQSNPAYAALAGEYFTLFLILRQQGLIEYDASDSDSDEVDVDDVGMLGGIFNSVPDKYNQAYKRFWALDKKINKGSRELKVAVNKIHHSLAAELGDKASSNEAVLLVCEVLLGFVPVVGQVIDLYAIGEWGYVSYKEPAKLDDNLHLAGGALCLIGVIPGFGDAIKVSGKAIIKALKLGDRKSIQFAIKTIRSLSDGNLIKGLMKLRAEIKTYGQQAKAILQQVIAALKKMLIDPASNRWLIAMMKEQITGVIHALEKLSAKFDASLAYIAAKFDEFIGKVVTRVTGSPRAKGRAEVPEGFNAGRNKGEEHDAGKPPAEKTRAGQEDGNNCATNKTCQEKGEPVDMATGFVFERREDWRLASLLPVGLARYYRSGGQRRSGILGTLWRTEWDMSLELQEGMVIFTDGEFNQAFFTLPDEGEWAHSPSNPEWRLTRINGLLQLHHLDGRRYGFEHARGPHLYLTSMSDASGNRVRWGWERGRLVRVLLADGRHIRVSHQGRNVSALTLVVSEFDPPRELSRYEYDDSGALLRVRAGAGRSFDYQYSPQGWLTRWSDLAQTWVEHDYDSQGRCLANRCAGGYWKDYFRYDDANLTSYYHSAFGGVTAYVRDERNNILLRREPDGGETRFEWVNNQLAALVNPLGQRTEFERNAWGQVTCVTLPDGSVHRYGYDDAGRLLAYIDPLGQPWQYSYNPQGLVEGVTNPLGQCWRHEYTPQGLVAAVTDPVGHRSQWHYGEQGLPVRYEPANGAPWRFVYDQQDRLVARYQEGEQGALVRRWEYRHHARQPSKVIYEDGTESRFDYDIEGNLVRLTDALGHHHQLTYGAFDNLQSVTDPLGATTRYHYNAESDFAGVTNSQGHHWRYEFDACGRVATEVHYDGRRYDYRYDVAGQLVLRRAPDNRELHYHYDVLGRLARIEAWRAQGEHSDPIARTKESETHFAYDAAGRLLRASNADAVVEYEWDALGRVVCERVNGETIESHYGEAGQREAINGLLAPLGLSWQQGRLTQLTVGSRQPLQFARDRQGREQVRQSEAGFALNQGWSATGLLLSQSLVPASGAVPDTLSRHYQYDALDRLVGVNDSHWGEQGWKLNGNGQVVAERSKRGHERQARLFGYDSELNLCELSHILPSDGQPLSSQQAQAEPLRRYDAAGRVSQIGQNQYRYDKCGRLSEKVVSRPGFRPQTTQFEWDGFDRLQRVILPDGSRWRYRYDSFGRRIGKEREGQVSQLTAITRVHYRWDGDQLVQQQSYRADGNAARQVQWVYEPGSFRPLAQWEAGEQEDRLHYIVTDVVGTARELCSETGDIIWRGEQRLWGNYRADAIPQPLRRFLGDAANDETYCELRYQGQLYDQETGLYYNRHRYFDPELGQYISPDPIGFAGGLRPQGYVHNPLEWVDPLGLTPLNQGGFSVYGLYDQGADKPYYIGISNDASRRLEEHAKTGRFDEFTGRQEILKDNVTFAEARGHEQAYIEHYGTKTGNIGEEISSANRGNKYNSFDKSRTDDRGKAFNAEYEKAKLDINKPKKNGCG